MNKKMADIDPVEFGKLFNAVETLNERIERLTHEVDTIRSAMNSSKGIAIGLMLAAGGVGAGASKFVEAIIKGVS